MVRFANQDQPLIKLLVKVLDEDADKLVWEHVCYLPRGLYLEFLRSKGIDRVDFVDYLTKWAKDDFNVDFPVTTVRQLQMLKALIIDKYNSVYPHITRKTKTDHQGWTRVWIAQYMEKGLKR